MFHSRNIVFTEVIFMAKTELGVRPLHDRILVRRMAEEEKTAGGLFIPDSAKEKPQRGEIVAAGKGRVTEDGKTLALEVKAGDKVLFSKYAGTEIKLSGEEYLMMREEDILGIIQ
jgi:chaperonin GroES